MKRKVIVKEDSNPFALSVGDLMAGMLAVFILALMGLMLQYQMGTEQLQAASTSRTEILTDIKERLHDTNGQVEVDTEAGVIRVNIDSASLVPESAKGIFDIGKSELTPSGKEIMLQIIQAIQGSKEHDINHKWSAIETILIEGHSDNHQYAGFSALDSRKENIRLSQERALNTMMFMGEYVGDINNFRNIRGKPLFSVAGYGESRPLIHIVNGKEVEAPPEKNRRIEFRFLTYNDNQFINEQIEKSKPGKED